jgi:hypothetical protein
MTGVIVLVVVFVLLTTRTRKARKRWRKSLGWCWAVLLWVVLPRPSVTSGRPSAARPGTSAPYPLARSPRAFRWPPAQPRLPHYSPSDERPGQGPRYFSYEQKQALLITYGGKCAYCGSMRQPRADHKHPYSWGGKTILENGQILCDPCNTRKGANWTDVHDPGLLEIVCVEHMLPRNRFGSGRPPGRRSRRSARRGPRNRREKV